MDFRAVEGVCGLPHSAQHFGLQNGLSDTAMCFKISAARAQMERPFSLQSGGRVEKIVDFCPFSRGMVHVRFGSRPPSWPQNEVKVLVDAESSLYSSSIETPGPARPWRENVLRPRSSAGLPRLYPFWIIPSDLFPFLCLKPLISLFV